MYDRVRRVSNDFRLEGGDIGRITIAIAYWPQLPIKAEAGLAIALAKALLTALLFMQRRSATGMVGLAAMAGVVWGSFLFLLTFANLLTRSA